MDTYTKQAYRASKPICYKIQCKKCIFFSLYYTKKIKYNKPNTIIPKKIDYCYDKKSKYLPNEQLFRNILNNPIGYFLSLNDNKDWDIFCEDGKWRNTNDLNESVVNENEFNELTKELDELDELVYTNKKVNCNTVCITT